MIEKGITGLIILSVVVVLGIAACGLYLYMDEVIRSYFFT
jgi:hypothetical protein